MKTMTIFRVWTFNQDSQSVKFKHMFPHPNNDKNQNMKYMEPKIFR